MTDTTLKIDSKISDKWKRFYDKHNKSDFPTLKFFTEKKLESIMALHDYNNGGK